VERTQNAAIRSSIGAPEIVRRDVKHIQIIFKLATFYTLK